MSEKPKEGWTDIPASSPKYEWDTDTKKWEGGNTTLSKKSVWRKGGIPTRGSKFINTEGIDELDKIAPLKNLQIYPSVDPYLYSQRELFRILMKECPWVQRANRIIQELTMQNSDRMAFPRDGDEMSEEELEAWRETPMIVPNLNGDGKEQKMTPNEIKKFIDKLSSKLDLDSLVFDAFLFEREQGRSAIAMFPEERDKITGLYVLPQTLRVIRPDLLRRPIINFNTGELAGIELNQLSSNGGLLDANRCIYFYLSKNLELYGDFYGISSVEAITDVGKALLIIYARDFENAANRTWRTPNIYKHNLPTKDFAEAQTRLEAFNERLENNTNSDVSITHDVDVVIGATNSGDIAGLVAIENSCIDAIAGYYNIPPFMLAKGKAGNLGGNSNREEIDAFLTNEIKPNQARYENILKAQFYDRILAIIFDVEPNQASTLEMEISHNYEKPSISSVIDPGEWNIMMGLVKDGMSSYEQVMEKYGLRDIMTNPTNQGTDASPTIKTWEKSMHPTWANKAPKGWQSRREELSKWHDHAEWNGNSSGWDGDSKWDKIQNKKMDVMSSAKKHMDKETELIEKKLDEKDKERNG